MNNERGLTLVELLAGLAILGIIVAVIGSALMSGIKASERNTTNQLLQQEANKVIEMIRVEYLSPGISHMQLGMDGADLTLNSTVISSGFDYSLYKIVDGEVVLIEFSETPIAKSQPFQLQLRISKDASRNIDINTTFSKLQ